jgi:guanyl-specific ribonuclease Sa
MDPILVIPVTLVVAATAFYIYRNFPKNDNTDNVSAAKNRAIQRAQERQWAETQPADNWGTIYNFSTEQSLEIDDKYNGRAALSAEEKKIVNTILAGVDVNYIDDVEKFGNIFGNDNKVECVDPWSGTIR